MEDNIVSRDSKISKLMHADNIYLSSIQYKDNYVLEDKDKYFSGIIRGRLSIIETDPKFG